MKKQEDLEAMIQAQSERFNALQARKIQVKCETLVLIFFLLIFNVMSKLLFNIEKRFLYMIAY